MYVVLLPAFLKTGIMDEAVVKTPIFSSMIKDGISDQRGQSACARVAAN